MITLLLVLVGALFVALVIALTVIMLNKNRKGAPKYPKYTPRSSSPFRPLSRSSDGYYPSVGEGASYSEGSSPLFNTLHVMTVDTPYTPSKSTHRSTPAWSDSPSHTGYDSHSSYDSGGYDSGGSDSGGCDSGGSDGGSCGSD